MEVRSRRTGYGLLAILLALLLAAPAGSPAKPSRRQAKASTAVKLLAAGVLHGGPRSKQVRRDIRKAARLVAGRRACAALGAVEEVRAALGKVKRKHRRALRKAVKRAERALRGLKSTRTCAPKVHRFKLTLIHPTFNPNGPPAIPSHEQGGEDDYTVPADRHAKPLAPQGAPTDVSGSTQAGAADVTSPLQIFGSTDLGVLGNAYPQEPQVAEKSNVVLYSGNLNGAVSFDGGAHFTTLDPGHVFGNDQTMCCDTVVRYAPSIDRFIWILQYWCDPGTSTNPADHGGQTASCFNLAMPRNRYRIAVISPAQLLAHRADPTQGWTVYDLTANALGSNTWLDYPDASVGSSDLYMTCDEVGVGGLNIRIPLSQLTGRGVPSGQWFRADNIFWRTAENVGITGLYLKNDTDSRDIAYAWPDALSFPLELGLPHATRPDFGFSTLTPSGQNWADRTGSPIVKGATMSGNSLWVAWTAGRYYRDGPASTPSYPQDHIQLAVYDTGDLFHALFTGSLRLTDERYVWSSTIAYTNPILATNSDGDVAMTFAGADAHSMPSPYVAILTNRPFTVRAATSQGPTIAVEGDYAGLTRDFDDPTKWVAANTFTTTDSGGRLGAHWLYTQFGRGPNPPPPARLPTSVTLRSVTGTMSQCCFYGDTFHTNGNLAGTPPASTVRVDYSNGAMSFSHTATTDVEGNFTDAWTVPTSTNDQVWTITAHYAGDATHQPADSDPFLQNVQPPPG
jgi:hypothetical protein